jgi:hypothetical protein
MSLFTKKLSAQAYMKAPDMNVTPSACGTSCGAGEKEAEEKPSACGTSCGAGDKEPEEKPSTVGTSCGAGDK